MWAYVTILATIVVIILLLIVGPKRNSAILIFRLEGVPKMPASIAVNGKGGVYTLVEFDGAGGTGNVVPDVGPVQFTSSDPTVATIDNLGNVTAVKAGTVTITGTDTGDSIVATDVLTVTDVAVSGVLQFKAN